MREQGSWDCRLLLYHRSCCCHGAAGPAAAPGTKGPGLPPLASGCHRRVNSRATAGSRCCPRGLVRLRLLHGTARLALPSPQRAAACGSALLLIPRPRPVRAAGGVVAPHRLVLGQRRLAAGEGRPAGGGRAGSQQPGSASHHHTHISTTAVTHKHASPATTHTHTHTRLHHHHHHKHTSAWRSSTRCRPRSAAPLGSPRYATWSRRCTAPSGRDGAGRHTRAGGPAGRKTPGSGGAKGGGGRGRRHRVAGWWQVGWAVFSGPACERLMPQRPSTAAVRRRRGPAAGAPNGHRATVGTPRGAAVPRLPASCLCPPECWAHPCPQRRRRTESRAPCNTKQRQQTRRLSWCLPLVGCRVADRVPSLRSDGPCPAAHHTHRLPAPQPTHSPDVALGDAEHRNPKACPGGGAAQNASR